MLELALGTSSAAAAAAAAAAATTAAAPPPPPLSAGSPAALLALAKTCKVDVAGLKRELEAKDKSTTERGATK